MCISKLFVSMLHASLARTSLNEVRVRINWCGFAPQKEASGLCTKKKGLLMRLTLRTLSGHILAIRHACIVTTSSSSWRCTTLTHFSPRVKGKLPLLTLRTPLVIQRVSVEHHAVASASSTDSGHFPLQRPRSRRGTRMNPCAGSVHSAQYHPLYAVQMKVSRSAHHSIRHTQAGRRSFWSITAVLQ